MNYPKCNALSIGWKRIKKNNQERNREIKAGDSNSFHSNHSNVHGYSKMASALLDLTPKNAQKRGHFERTDEYNFVLRRTPKVPWTNEPNIVTPMCKDINEENESIRFVRVVCVCECWSFDLLRCMYEIRIINLEWLPIHTNVPTASEQITIVGISPLYIFTAVHAFILNMS